MALKMESPRGCRVVAGTKLAYPVALVLVALALYVEPAQAQTCGPRYTLRTWTFATSMTPAGGGPACTTGNYRATPCYYQVPGSTTYLRFDSRGALPGGYPTVDATIGAPVGTNNGVTLRFQEDGGTATATSDPPTQPGAWPPAPAQTGVAYFRIEFLTSGLVAKNVAQATVDIYDVDQNQAGTYRDKLIIRGNAFSRCATLTAPGTSAVVVNQTGTPFCSTTNWAGHGTRSNSSNNPAGPDFLRGTFQQNVNTVEMQYYSPPTLGTSLRYVGINQIRFCEAQPTNALISEIRALPDRGEGILEFKTSSEIGPLGFYVRRVNDMTGERVRVNEGLVPAFVDSPAGGVYRVSDPELKPGKTLQYEIVEVRMGGGEDVYGPYTLRLDPKGSLTQAQRAEILDSGYSRNPHEMNALVEPAGQPALRAQAATAVKVDLSKGLKLGVVEDGLYLVTSQDLSAWTGESEADIKTLIKKRLLQISNRGVEVPWRPAAGNSGFYFNGSKSDSAYTTENVYWLQKARFGTGHLMEEQDGRSPAAVAGQTFLASRSIEQNRIPVTALDAEPGSDFWYWDVITGTGSKTFTASLDGVAGSTERATLRMLVRNAVGGPNVARISVNGIPVGEGAVAGGTDRSTVEVSFDQSYLKEGENVIGVERSAVGSTDDGFFVDRFDVTYRRVQKAFGERLEVLPEEPGAATTISGFKVPGITVLDITNPAKPIFVTNTRIEPDGGGYRVSFSSTSGRPDKDSRYLAVSDNGLKKPVWARAATSGNQMGSPGGQYVVITPSAFLEVASAFANYRRGLNPKVVALESIYDEFNDGIAEPTAIKKFIAFAMTRWKEKPRSVALLGNGTYDYKDYLGRGDNFLPPMLSSMSGAGLFSSDNALADVDDDGRIDVAVGRIPIISVAQGLSYLSKVREYERSGGDWARRAWLWADQTDAIDYAAESDEVAQALPAGYSASTVYLSQLDIAAARQKALDGLNAGTGLVNFLGHGGTDRLAKEGLLTQGDIASLSNAGKYPVVSALTCVINRFEIPGYASIGEQLVLRDGGGAIAVWAPTTLSFPEDTKSMDLALFAAYSDENARPQGIGQAVKTALRTYGANGMGNIYHLRSYTLLGDPAVTMQTP